MRFEQFVPEKLHSDWRNTATAHHLYSGLELTNTATSVITPQTLNNFNL